MLINVFQNMSTFFSLLNATTLVTEIVKKKETIQSYHGPLVSIVVFTYSFYKLNHYLYEEW
jgi:hypothetical protein